MIWLHENIQDFFPHSFLDMGKNFLLYGYNLHNPQPLDNEREKIMRVFILRVRSSEFFKIPKGEQLKSWIIHQQNINWMANNSSPKLKRKWALDWLMLKNLEQTILEYIKGPSYIYICIYIYMCVCVCV